SALIATTSGYSSANDANVLPDVNCFAISRPLYNSHVSLWNVFCIVILLSSFNFFYSTFNIIFTKVRNMPLISMFHEGNTFACNSGTNDYSRNIRISRRQIIKTFYHWLYIMTVYSYNIPSEAFPVFLQCIDVHHFICMSIYSHFIIINTTYNVPKSEAGSPHRGFPALAFLHFAVSHQ